MGRPVYHTLPIAQIAREYESGDTLRAIAQRHLIGYGTVRRILAAAGVAFRDNGRRNPAHAPTHTVKDTYVPSEFWNEISVGTLPQAEVTRLRRAVGWNPAWAGPYDATNGD